MATAGPNKCHVLKTDTMHSDLMSNAKCDLITEFATEAKFHQSVDAFFQAPAQRALITPQTVKRQQLQRSAFYSHFLRTMQAGVHKAASEWFTQDGVK